MKKDITIAIYGQDYTSFDNAYIQLIIDGKVDKTLKIKDLYEIDRALSDLNDNIKELINYNNDEADFKNAKAEVIGAIRRSKNVIKDIYWRYYYEIDNVTRRIRSSNKSLDRIKNIELPSVKGKRKNDPIKFELNNKIASLNRDIISFKETRDILFNKLPPMFEDKKPGPSTKESKIRTIIDSFEILSIKKKLNRLERLVLLPIFDEEILKEFIEYFKEVYESLSKQRALVYDELLKNSLDRLNDKIGFFQSEDSKVLIVSSSDEDTDKELSFYAVSNNGLSFNNIVGTVSTKIEKTKAVDDLVKGVFPKTNTKDVDSITIRFNIYSRFDDFENVVLNGKTPFFLSSLLIRSRNLNPTGVDYESTYDNEPLFDFLLIILIRKSIKSAFAKGFFKKYQRFEINSEKIKGSIDIARHIKLNAGRDNGKIACSYRENTVDNIVNHLMFAALDYLDSKYQGIVQNNLDNETSQKLNQLKYEIGYPKYSRSTLIAKNLIPVSHPFYSEYRDLQKYCLMVLRDEGVSPFGITDKSVEGILFYVNDLWEEFLESFLKEMIRVHNSVEESDTQTEYRLYSQRKISTMLEANAQNKYLDDFDEEEVRINNESRPDYVWAYQEGENYKPFLILDAKYRPMWKEALKGILHDIDNKKDYNKCLRDMVSIDSFASGVIFPMEASYFINEFEACNSQPQYVHLFSRFNRNGRFYTIPVLIPCVGDIDTFRKWDKELKRCIEPCINLIGGYQPIECEKAKRYHRFLKDNEKEINKLNNDIEMRDIVLPVIVTAVDDKYDKESIEEEFGLSEGSELRDINAAYELKLEDGLNHYAKIITYSSLKNEKIAISVIETVLGFIEKNKAKVYRVMMLFSDYETKHLYDECLKNHYDGNG